MPAFDFAGTTSLVTGASSGLGEQFAPGLRTRLLAQGHRFLPRTVMARMTGKMLAPAGQHTTTDTERAATPPIPDARE